VTTDRCPACSAAVTAGAPWCTLCYADLRVPVASVPAPAEAAQAAEAAADPVALVPDPVALVPDAILDAPVQQAPPVARQKIDGWPCLGCGSVVPLADDACSNCGQPFLPAEAGPSLRVPGVGDVAKLEKPQRLMLIIGGSLALMALFFLVAFIAGSVF
jgi:hypothetical protein